MRHLILGTAGHIDHGKTALVRALTGTDTDRLKEEKARGITIELGFAHLELEGLSLGVVDVPGHERFIKAMVAGAGGIDLALLVVAADEGVMPQTREHLDICGLLGVRAGVVALTKADLVDGEWLELAADDVRGALAGSPLAEAPIVPCSAVSGAGLDALRAALAAQAARVPERDAGGMLRIPLDRVFSMKGFGTVVTGTLLSGSVAPGQPVLVLPSDVTAPVRRVQVHGALVARAVAGQRVALNLGGVSRREVARGEVLTDPGPRAAARMIDVQLTLLPTVRRPLGARSRVLFHLGTRQQEAACVLVGQERLVPGERALAQLRFDRAVVALPGDRFILRGFEKLENHGTTIGGGEVVRVLGRKLRTADREAAALLARMTRAEPRERVALEVLAAGARGLDRQGLQMRLPFSPAALERHVSDLLARGELVRFDRDRGAVIHAEPLGRLEARARAIVARFHEESPLAAGIGREELRSRLGRAVDPRLFHALLRRLEKAGALVVAQDLCRSPDHRRAAGAAAIRPLADRLAALYDGAGLAPPREAELAERAGAGEAEVRQAIGLLLDEGVLVRVGPLCFAARHVDELEGRLRAFLAEKRRITAPEFKALVGQTRKFVIPLAEHFDARKVTIRVGDERRLRG